MTLKKTKTITSSTTKSSRESVAPRRLLIRGVAANANKDALESLPSSQGIRSLFSITHQADSTPESQAEDLRASRNCPKEERLGTA